MILRGGNLGDVETEFKNLSDYDWIDDERLMNIIKKVELLYQSLDSKAKESEVSFMNCDEDGHVIIPEHAVNHRCASEMDSLENIANNGVLASEWFGEIESEGEGRFCSFVSRMKGPNYPLKGDLGEDDNSRLNIGSNVILFFDENNAVMQYLLHLDFFQFAYLKKTNPDYRKLYKPEELEILEELIEPLSPCGLDMRKKFDIKTNYWSAIPGGIPSCLINGICIKKNIYTDDELDHIGEMFPNAIIFNNRKEVLRYPKKQDVSQGLGM